MNLPPSFIQPSVQSSDKLDALCAKAAEARDLELIVSDLEEQLKARKTELLNLYSKVLPDLMDAANVDRVGLPATGNSPAVDFRLKPFYSANIAASWNQERKDIAFAFLDSMNASDLIKSEVVASLPKGNLELAERLVALASELKIPTVLTKRVHGNTLTAWLRELVENTNTIPSNSDLEKIGATIGRIVKPTERKE